MCLQIGFNKLLINVCFWSFNEGFYIFQNIFYVQQINIKRFRS